MYDVGIKVSTCPFAIQERERGNYHVGMCTLIMLLFDRKVFLSVWSLKKSWISFPLPQGKSHENLF